MRQRPALLKIVKSRHCQHLSVNFFRSSTFSVLKKIKMEGDGNGHGHSHSHGHGPCDCEREFLENREGFEERWNPALSSPSIRLGFLSSLFGIEWSQ